MEAGQVSITMAEVVHGSTATTAAHRRLVFPWYTGIKDDYKTLDQVEFGTFCRDFLRDLVLVPQGNPICLAMPSARHRSILRSKKYSGIRVGEFNKIMEDQALIEQEKEEQRNKLELEKDDKRVKLELEIIGIEWLRRTDVLNNSYNLRKGLCKCNWKLSKTV